MKLVKFWHCWQVAADVDSDKKDFNESNPVTIKQENIALSNRAGLIEAKLFHFNGSLNKGWFFLKIFRPVLFRRNH